jgi:excisionase family DNA binding protein
MDRAAVQPLLLDIEEVSKVLGIGTTKTWELVAAGTIFSVRVGRRRLVPLQSAEKYVAELIAAEMS